MEALVVYWKSATIVLKTSNKNEAVPHDIVYLMNWNKIKLVAELLLMTVWCGLLLNFLW